VRGLFVHALRLRALRRAVLVPAFRDGFVCVAVVGRSWDVSLSCVSFPGVRLFYSLYILAAPLYLLP